MTRTVYACDSCGWEWPHPTSPPEDAICLEDADPIEWVHPTYVATMDVVESTGHMTKDTAYKIVAQALREAEDRDDDFALTIAIVDALWAAQFDRDDDA